MGIYCTNFGNELKEDADVCLSCSRLNNNNTNNNEGKELAAISVVFGSLICILPFFIGKPYKSLIGIINPKSQYKSRSKIGLGLSIGSLIFFN